MPKGAVHGRTNGGWSPGCQFHLCFQSIVLSDSTHSYASRKLTHTHTHTHTHTYTRSQYWLDFWQLKLNFPLALPLPFSCPARVQVKLCLLYQACCKCVCVCVWGRVQGRVGSPSRCEYIWLLFIVQRQWHDDFDLSNFLIDCLSRLCCLPGINNLNNAWDSSKGYTQNHICHLNKWRWLRKSRNHRYLDMIGNLYKPKAFYLYLHNVYVLWLSVNLRDCKCSLSAVCKCWPTFSIDTRGPAL